MGYHYPRAVTEIVSVHGQLEGADFPLTVGGKRDTIETRLDAFYQQNRLSPRHGDGVVYTPVDNVRDGMFRTFTKFWCCNAHKWTVLENAKDPCSRR